MSMYQTYLKDCGCSNGGIIIHDGDAVCRWCRTPYAKGGQMNYLSEHFKPKPQAENKSDRDWEILTCFDKIKHECKEVDWHEYTPKEDSTKISNCEDDKCRIRSVKRLSDGEVFSVKDYAGKRGYEEGYIKEFKIVGTDMYAVINHQLHHTINFLINEIEKFPPPPQPQKLFTTEDGVALVGQQGYVLSTDMWTFSSCTLPDNPFYGDHNQFKYFHSKEAAEKYIADNKPQPHKEEQDEYQYSGLPLPKDFISWDGVQILHSDGSKTDIPIPIFTQQQVDELCDKAFEAGRDFVSVDFTYENYRRYKNENP